MNCFKCNSKFDNIYYRCRFCDFFLLCSNCYPLDKSSKFHPNDHTFVRINTDLTQNQVVHINLKCDMCQNLDFYGDKYTKISYTGSNENICSPCFKDLEESRKKLFHLNNQTQPNHSFFKGLTEHSGIVCDCCDSKNNWKGIVQGKRFKCFQCEDYDLCEKCYVDRTEKIHPMDHNFILILGDTHKLNWELQKQPNLHRYHLCITTDKQMYKPGERMFVRGIILNVFTNKPCYEGSFSLKVSLIKARIESCANGSKVLKECTLAKPEESVVSFSWLIPMNICGGEYSIKIQPVTLLTHIMHGKYPFFPLAERKVEIMVYNSPKFKKDLIFRKKSYSQGEIIKALLSIERSEGGIPENGTVEVISVLDDIEIFRKSYKIDSSTGKVSIALQLPHLISEGVGFINCAITDGITESITKDLPISLRKLKFKVYPESGDLIQGISNGVYFQALTHKNEPAFLRGSLVEEFEGNSKKITKIETLHEGRGFFEFVPKKDREYDIDVHQPHGVASAPLSKIFEDGLSFRLLKRRSHEYNEDIFGFLTSTKDIKVTAEIFKKESLINSLEIDLLSFQERKISVSPKQVDGVVRITIKSTSTGIPLCERLIFIKPRDFLKFEVGSDRLEYSPGDKVKLFIKSKSLKSKKRVDCQVCISVTNDSTIRIKERRKRSPRILEIHYLEDEVKSIEDPHSYILPCEISTGEKSIDPDIACDLLMGTQGWRKFIYKKFKKNKYLIFQNKSIIDKEKLYRLLSVVDTKTDDIYLEKLEKIEENIKEMEELKRKRKNKKYRGSLTTRMKNYDDNDERIEFSEVRQVALKRNKYTFIGSRKRSKSRKEVNRSPIKKSTVKKVIFRNRNGRFIDTRFSREGQMPSSYSQSVENILTVEEEPDGHTQLKDFYKVNIEFEREYSHKNETLENNDKRVDFTETLYYSSSLKCSKETSIEFMLSDNISSYRVIIDGFSESGILGYDESFTINVKKPFYVAPKLPQEVSLKDIIQIPVCIVNNVDKKLTCCLEVKSKVLKLTDSIWKGILNPRERKITYFECLVKNNFVNSEHQILFIAEGQIQKTELKLNDSVVKEMKIHPFGFPKYFNFSGLLNEKDTKKEHRFKLPKDVIDFSVQSCCFLTPTFLGSILACSKKLIKCPSGCFEQVSSKLYPMIMAMQFFDKNEENMDPSILGKIEKYLQIGYEKLKEFQVPMGGFEWYGKAPANESLTAMGIMELIELSKIWPVDSTVIERSKKWLLNQKTKSGFLKSPGRYQYGFAPENAMNAYILFALSKVDISFYCEVKDILESFKKKIFSKDKKFDDCYVISLIALTYYHFNDKKMSLKITKILLQYIKPKTGSIDKGESTITRSGGVNKELEITSLSIMCFYLHGFNSEAYNGILFILKNNRCGTYGATQANVLSLQAILMFCERNANSSGLVQMKLNGEVKSKVEVPKNCNLQLYFEDISPFILSGGKENYLEIENFGVQNVPYNLQIACKVETPPTDLSKFPFSFSNVLKNTKLREGESTQIEVNIQNKTKELLPMIVDCINLPGGLRLADLENLKNLRNQEKFHFFELIGSRQIVFYWRSISPFTVIQFKFTVQANIPGKYQSDASEAYLYYSDDFRYYQKGLIVEILKTQS